MGAGQTRSKNLKHAISKEDIRLAHQKEKRFMLLTKQSEGNAENENVLIGQAICTFRMLLTERQGL